MLILRDIETIYSTCSHRTAPDIDYVRSKVQARLSVCLAPRDAYDWIERNDDPYLREVFATQTYRTIDEWATDGIDEHQINPTSREEIQDRLRKIIREAMRDQSAEEVEVKNCIDDSAPMPIDSSPNGANTCLAKLISKQQALEEQLAHIKSRLDAENPGHWPTFMPNVQEEVKYLVEATIRKIIRLGKKDMTAQLKTYLELKRRENIILRPAQQNAEWEILREFGYPYAQCSYYNA